MNARTESAELSLAGHLAHNRYFNCTFEVAVVKALPGEYCRSTSKRVLATVLGSCIAACIREREKNIGDSGRFR